MQRTTGTWSDWAGRRAQREPPPHLRHYHVCKATAAFSPYAEPGRARKVWRRPTSIVYIQWALCLLCWPGAIPSIRDATKVTINHHRIAVSRHRKAPSKCLVSLRCRAREASDLSLDRPRRPLSKRSESPVVQVALHGMSSKHVN